MEKIDLSILVPMWNETDVIETLISRLYKVIKELHECVEVVFVNDGSTDDTEKQILEKAAILKYWKLVNLSRNFGQQAAYRAGLDHVVGEAVIFLDADLQDPPEQIPQLVQEWKNGAKLVVGCRLSRAETGIRSLLFKGFHELFFRLTGGIMPKNSGTFALIDRIIVDHLKNLPEVNIFLPALRSWIGYRKTVIYYHRASRAAGKEKQSFRRLFGYAWDGITSFSQVPLRAISLIGFSIAIPSLIYGIILIVQRIFQFFGFFSHLEVLGFTTISVSIFFIGGIQLICLGIVGEYLGKIYQEVKSRPKFFVESIRLPSGKIVN